jgi:hypothetical protein
MTEDIRDIHGPIVHAASPDLWPYILAGALLLLAAYVVIRLIRRRRHAPPADERALRELSEARTLIESDRPHELSLRVSETVRGYVEEAFDIHAPRRTTQELLDDLMRVSSPVAPYRSELGAFLELCDLAKYARWSLSRTQMTDIVDRAEGFIRASAHPDKGLS